MTATSSQRLNLRPTSRSIADQLEAARGVQARDAAPPASIRAITAWNPLAAATSSDLGQQHVPDASA